MEMYANGSSFAANLTLQKQNSFRDVSFSSYLNKAEENMVRKLANQASELPNDHPYHMKPEEDEEIGVFGAEKYFKGEIEDECNKNDLRFTDTNTTTRITHQQDQKPEEFDPNLSTKPITDQTSIHTTSVRSNASSNSRSELLPHNKPSPEKTKNRNKTRTFLARFSCNCMNKKSTQINEEKIIHPKQTDQVSSKPEEKKTKNEYFSFPLLTSNDLNSNSNTNSSSNSNTCSSLNSKSGNLAGKVVKVANSNNNNTGRLSLGRKLSLLNELEDEMYKSSSRMYNHDFDSDSSSDLFEIESFSPTGDGPYIGQRKSNCYAPSEVSIEWSVVTASAAEFLVVSDYDDVRTGGGSGGAGGGWRNSGGVFSGCVSHKAVRVAGDECKVGGGGGGGGGRRRSLESTAVGSAFRGGWFDPRGSD